MACCERDGRVAKAMLSAGICLASQPACLQWLASANAHKPVIHYDASLVGIHRESTLVYTVPKQRSKVSAIVEDELQKQMV